MGGELAIQQLAQFFDGHMHDKTDIAHAEARDVSDLLVGTIVGEFEPDDFLLIGP